MLELQGLIKDFGGLQAVRGVDLTIAQGEFFSLLGPSGCGKTTLLRMLSGLETPDRGAIRMDGREIHRLPPDKRHFNMVFQRYALFPHLNVEDNIAFGLRARRIAAGEITTRVREMLALVRLEGFNRRSVTELSGGQQQRVALARALVNRPKVLLLDEPLSALDLKLRQQMQVELLAIQRRLNLTFVLVTHDQEEALTLSDRVAVMHAGRIEQVGTPREIYDRPATEFVARFIGSINVLEGRVRSVDAGVTELDNGLRIRSELALRPGEAVRLLIRPERIRLGRDPLAPNRILGEVREALYQGALTQLLVRARLQGAEVDLQATLPNLNRGSAPDFEPGQPVELNWSEEDGLLLAESREIRR